MWKDYSGIVTKKCCRGNVLYKNLCHKFAIVTVAVVSILRSSSNIALKSNILAYVEMFPGDAGSACIVRSVP